MKISELFPTGNYLNAATVKNQRLSGKPLTITLVDLVQLRDRSKLVLSFKEIDKRLVLNKTNMGVLTELYGDETDKWIGKKICLAISKVIFQGRRVDGITVTGVE